MSEVKTIMNGERFEMYTPYSKSFISKIKTIGSAKWNPEKRCWTVKEEDQKKAKEILLSVYGEDGETAQTTYYMKFECTEDYNVWCDSARLCGKIVARATGRDSGAKVGEDVVLEKGTFTSGGSAKNWETQIEKGAIFTLKHVPKSKIDDFDKDYFTKLSCEKEGVDADALKAEKEKLLARIAEIDKILKNL